jgi:hypothetical protein
MLLHNPHLENHSKTKWFPLYAGLSVSLGLTVHLFAFGLSATLTLKALELLFSTHPHLFVDFFF